jgi:hypothetical protein
VTTLAAIVATVMLSGAPVPGQGPVQVKDPDAEIVENLELLERLELLDHLEVLTVPAPSRPPEEPPPESPPAPPTPAPAKPPPT